MGTSAALPARANRSSASAASAERRCTVWGRWGETLERTGRRGRNHSSTDINTQAVVQNYRPATIVVKMEAAFSGRNAASTLKKLPHQGRSSHLAREHTLQDSVDC